MQTRDLVELSGQIAVHGRLFVRGKGRLSCNGVQEYWASSRTRFDRWHYVLVRFQDQPEFSVRQWRRIRPVMEEIFASELLTRLWTAVVCEYDRRRGTSYVSPVVRSTFLGHLDARNRALNVIARAFDEEVDEALPINRFRGRSERWNDLLLAYLLPDCSVEDFAFDYQRVRDFSEDLPDQNSARWRVQSWHLLQASLRAAFASRGLRRCGNEDLNARIASGIRACFQPDQFESPGRLRSLWMQRLTRTAADTEALISELLLLEKLGPNSPPAEHDLQRR